MGWLWLMTTQEIHFWWNHLGRKKNLRHLTGRVCNPVEKEQACPDLQKQSPAWELNTPPCQCRDVNAETVMASTIFFEAVSSEKRWSSSWHVIARAVRLDFQRPEQMRICSKRILLHGANENLGEQKGVRWLASASSPSPFALSFLIGQQKLRERSWKRPLRVRHPPHTPQEHPPYQACPPCPLPIIHSNIIPDRGCPGLIYQPIHSTDDKLVNPKSSRFRHHSGLGRDWVSRISIKSQQIIVAHSECWAAGKLDKNLSNHLRDLVHFHARRFKFARSAHEARLFQRLSGIWVGFDWMAGRF